MPGDNFDIPQYPSEIPTYASLFERWGNKAHVAQLAWAKRIQLIRMCEAQNWRCCYCHNVMHIKDFGEPGNEYATREHVIARYHHGTDGDENIVAACSDCNSKRGTKNPYTFVPARTYPDGSGGRGKAKAKKPVTPPVKSEKSKRRNLDLDKVAANHPGKKARLAAAGVITRNLAEDMLEQYVRARIREKTASGSSWMEATMTAKRLRKRITQVMVHGTLPLDFDNVNNVSNEQVPTYLFLKRD